LILRVLKKVNGHCDLRAKTSHEASIRYVNAGFAALVAVVSAPAPLWSLATHAERRSVRLLADLKECKAVAPC
jgi:TfoX/Sxy family transcriptional regulator of competence genes